MVELLLPVALAAALLLVVARHVRFWDLRTAVGQGVFAGLLVAVSILLSIRVDLVTLRGRQKRGTRQLLNRADAWSRLVKFVLGGLVIPVAAFVAASRVELPGHRTAMALAVEAGSAKPRRSLEAGLADAVLASGDRVVKVEGIRALRAAGSSEALAQLLRILTEDPSAVRAGAERQALAAALASFGARARPGLLRLFRATPAAERHDAGPPPGTLFDRYFGPAFDGARDEIASGPGGAEARADALARLDASAAELRGALGAIGSDSGARGAGLPSFVMQTLLAMKADGDPTVLAFARATAADPGWSDAVRGQALLLVGTLGSADDVAELAPFLGSPSGVLQACAMRAIAELEGGASRPAK